MTNCGTSILKTAKAAECSKQAVKYIRSNLRKAKEQNSDLCNEYIHDISEFKTYQLVFINESGCDRRIGFRRMGWAPSSIAPVQVPSFIAINITKFSLHTPKMVLSCSTSSNAQQTQLSLRSSLKISFGTVGSTQRKGPCL
ncbi:uncharacterized protein An04g07595 [Aspergillus niger]|uniref:Contig An04c0220, genomic contig n=2 Tax=Aspergillus niger TaxID=5061 RepID=A2QJM6_ASPNC|nr:uncharacterized protein An04g07595 [Aspergillus niger]CAK38916.1 unnamed protein product [Aspergillus niger]